MTGVAAPLRIATGTVLVLAALVLVARGGSAAVGNRVLQRGTASEIEALAMDGSRIAYDVGAGYGAGSRCNAVFVWNVATGATTRVSGDRTCAADRTSTGTGVSALAIAGRRVAWIVNRGGNTESSDDLYLASSPRPRERLVASAVRTGDTGGILTGDWLGGLVGGNGFLAVNHWETDSQGAVASPRLETVGARLNDLAQGSATMVARSSDGKLVAVLRLDGTVGVYSTRGKLLRGITPRAAREVAVRGDYLAVLTGARTLEVYNSHSGRRLHTWRVANGAAHLDVSSGLAAYAAPSGRGQALTVVHVLRLSTGKDRVVTTRVAVREISSVQLEPAGLAYAAERPDHKGRLVFVPMSRLPR